MSSPSARERDPWVRFDATVSKWLLGVSKEPEVLSAAVPKSAHSIEQLMAEGRATGQALIA